MEAVIVNGKRVSQINSAGFTLIEILLVMVLISLLAGLAAPVVHQSIIRGKEAVLKQNLYTTRVALDDYFADKGQYPMSVEVLVDEKYLRSLPFDPFEKRDDAWLEIDSDIESVEGVIDIKSSSSKTALDGTFYSDW